MTNTATQTAAYAAYVTYNVSRFMIHRNLALDTGGVAHGVTADDALAMFTNEGAAVAFAQAQMREDGHAARYEVVMFGLRDADDALIEPVGFQFGVAA